MSRKRKHVICKGVGHPSPSIPGSTTPVSAPGSTVPVQQPTPVSVPGSTVPVQQPTPVSVPGSTASLQQPNPVCAHTSTVPTTMSQSAIQPTLVLNYTSGSATFPFREITGYTVPSLTDTLQWTLPAEFCHACTFIALYF